MTSTTLNTTKGMSRTHTRGKEQHHNATTRMQNIVAQHYLTKQALRSLWCVSQMCRSEVFSLGMLGV
jgi:hypothetical protein